MRRDTPGMCFESYAMRINTLRDIDCKKEEKKITLKRLQVKNTNMTMTSVNKVQFASLNHKRYYFSHGIVSLIKNLYQKYIYGMHMKKIKYYNMKIELLIIMKD